MILYLLNVSLCLLVFLLFYGGLLRYATFFGLNRYYLVLGIIASFIIPGITISGVTQPYDLSLTSNIETTWIETTYSVPAGRPDIGVDTGITYTLILSVIYFVGVFIVLIRLLLWIARYVRLITSHEVRHVDNIPVISISQPQAFTFFNVIILPDHEVDPAILAHEKVHVTQCHWVDLLLIELTCVVLWFNPFVFLYRKAIKLQHEYLADSHTIESGVTMENYLHCLLSQLQLENSFVLINKFHSHPIKNRIMMMTKTRTPMKFKSVYLLLIPVLCLLLVAFSSKQVAFTPEIVTDNDQPVTNERDAAIDDNKSVIVEFALQAGDNKPSMAPVQMAKAKISATYGNRIHPMLGKKRLHTGIDFQLVEGEIVMTTANGTVVESKSDSFRGNYVIVKHDDVYTTSYFHMKRTLVKVGDPVKQGQTIGYVGSSGLSKEPHLHYEVIKNGKQVDPKGYLPEK